MKKILNIFALFIILNSCGGNSDGAIKYLENEKLHYDIKAYKVKNNNINYFVLMNEEDFYFLVNNLSLVKTKQEYFAKRGELIKKSVEIDSETFSNYQSKIVYLDSCSNDVVNNWVNLIENEPKKFQQRLIVDSTVSQINVNCIYFHLLNDSFKIYQEDVSGYYKLSN